MADLRNHNLTVNYLGAEQTIPVGTSRVEFWGQDAVPWTADAEVIVRLTDQEGTTVERRVQTGQTYVPEFTGRGAPSSWTYNMRAIAGTPVGVAVIT